MEDEDLYTRITLRIPKELHQKLADEAKSASKSLNAEIVGRLSSSFDTRHADQMVLSAAVVEGLEERLDRQTKVAHNQVLLAGLQGQLRDVGRRISQQNQLLARIQKKIEAVEEGPSSLRSQNLWSEWFDEKKWLDTLNAEYAVLDTEWMRLRKELDDMEGLVRDGAEAPSKS